MKPCEKAGRPLADVLAAVALTRVDPDDGGLSWSPAEWARVWGVLSPVQQRVVYKHLLLGLQHAEIARRIGVSRGSVLAAWGRALARIRDVLPAAA
jgi:DNA-directed RNA polymerase specialized sigma24 family protein